MSTNPSKDRASLCCFSFADGRQCRTPRSPTHPHFCVQHARKEAEAVAAQKAGNDISSYLNNNNYLSACDLSLALGQLFSCVAQGLIKPKTGRHLSLSRPNPPAIHPHRSPRIHQRLRHRLLA
jgi:hypothetical protein